MAYLIDNGHLVDTRTGQRWRPDEMVNATQTAADAALCAAGNSYHRITGSEALIFAGHSALGVRLRDADETRERASLVLRTIQSDLTDETLAGTVYRAPCTPELLDHLLRRLDEADAAINAVWAEAAPIFDAARAK